MSPLLERLDERNVVALEQNLACSHIHCQFTIPAIALARIFELYIPSSLLPPLGPSCGLGSCFVLCLTSTASSMTRFMNSSKLLIEPDLHRGVLLQEFEDEVDRRQKDLVAASSLAVRHFVILWLC